MKKLYDYSPDIEVNAVLMKPAFYELHKHKTSSGLAWAICDEMNRVIAASRPAPWTIINDSQVMLFVGDPHYLTTLFGASFGAGDTVVVAPRDVVAQLTYHHDLAFTRKHSFELWGLDPERAEHQSNFKVERQEQS